MTSERSPDAKFEIGHVLFIDIVGYSKLLINEQSEQIRTLKEIVRGTEQFRLAEAEGKLLRLPTGDGGALVFRTSPEAPVLCALLISNAHKTGASGLVRKTSAPPSPVGNRSSLPSASARRNCSVPRTISFNVRICSLCSLISSFE